jgi:hypothetical protein
MTSEFFVSMYSGEPSAPAVSLRILSKTTSMNLE